jgi:predicted amidophosphoribosyltransferase
MVMKICPNCLVAVPKARRFCHQCGHDITKRPASKSKTSEPKGDSFKLMFSALLWIAFLTISYVSFV